MKMTRLLAFASALLLFAFPAVGAEPDIAKKMQPVPESAIFSDPDYNVWCGSMVEGDDGKYHLFYSRWPKKLGHLAWVTHSEVARAVADNPLGPYKHVDVVLPVRDKSFWDGLCTHNPTVMRFGKKYYLYYMGNTGDGKPIAHALNWTHRNNQRIGVAVADSPAGPWQRFDKPVIDISADQAAPDALCIANPSVVEREDGTYLMVYKAVARKGKMPFGGPVVHLTATSKTPIGPFDKQLKPIFSKEGVGFAAEDPFVWREGKDYFAIVKDMGGHFTGMGTSLALFVSPDGFEWKPGEHLLVSTLSLKMADGSVRKLKKLERPQIWSKNGKPAILFCAAADTENLGDSFNVAIPLEN